MYLYNMSFSIILDSSTISNYPSNDFTVTFPNPIKLNTNPNEITPFEVALINGNFWYSWFNISASQGNNTVRWSKNSGSTYTTIIIPDGSYQLTDINTYIQTSITANGGTGASIAITPNFTILQCVVTLASGYYLDLSVSSLNILLGFPSAIVTTTQSGGNLVDITNGVNSVIINSDLVSGSFINGQTSSALYQFVPTSPPGSNLSIQPYYPIYLPLADQTQIQRVRLFITDQQNRTLNLNKQPVTVLLHVRPSGSTQ